MTVVLLGGGAGSATGMVSSEDSAIVADNERGQWRLGTGMPILGRGRWGYSVGEAGADEGNGGARVSFCLGEKTKGRRGEGGFSWF